MATHVRITLPVEVADELVREKLAVRPIVTRGSTVTDILQIAVDVISTGSDIVTVAVAGSTCRRIAQSIIQRRRHADPDRMTLSVVKNGKTDSLQVDLSKPDAQDEVINFLLSSMQ